MRNLVRATAVAALVVGLLPGVASGTDEVDRPALAAAPIPGLYPVNILVDGVVDVYAAALDPATGYVWTAQGSRGIVAYDHVGNTVASIEYGSEFDETAFPTSIEVVDGEVFATEPRADRVHVFDTSGDHRRSWGVSGTGAGEFDEPCGIEVVGNELFVADTGNDRVQVFNKDNGAYLREFAETAVGGLSLACYGDIVTHHAGEIFVSDQNTDSVGVFGIDGTHKRNIAPVDVGIVAGVDASGDGIIWVTEPDSALVSAWTVSGPPVGEFGVLGSGLGALAYPWLALADPAGDALWVLERGNGRIQTFTTVRCFGKTLTHVGTSYPDTLTLTDGDDVVRLKGGNDTVYGGAGNDTICGGFGNDTIHGNLGADVLFGELGNDRIFGGVGNDKVYGVGGDDVLRGGPGADTIDGGPGKDHIRGGDHNDTIRGLEGPDIIFGELGADTIEGNKGNDTLKGNKGNDTISGHEGADRLFGGLGIDVCNGNLGVDTAAGCENISGVP